MKPKPFSSLNHFTVPVAICAASSRGIPGGHSSPAVTRGNVPAHRDPPVNGRLPAAGHGRQDHQHVAAADWGVEPVEDADVLVVEVDVDVAVEVAAFAEELALRGGVLLG